MKSKMVDLIMYLILIAFCTYWLISEESPAVYVGIYVVCALIFLVYKTKKLKESR